MENTGKTKEDRVVTPPKKGENGPGSEGGSVGIEGRKFPKSTPDSAQHEELVEIQNQTEEENSVTQDIGLFKKYLRNLTGKVNEKVQPIAKEGLEKSKEAISKTKSDIVTQTKKKTFDFSIVKKLLVVVMIILFLVIVGIVGVGFYIRSQQPSGQTPTSVPTPTPPSYQTYKPSVYAKDPEVLSIEQTLDILNREMDTTNLNEDDLLPPKLDFNISFR